MHAANGSDCHKCQEFAESGAQGEITLPGCGRVHQRRWETSPGTSKHPASWRRHGTSPDLCSWCVLITLTIKTSLRQACRSTGSLREPHLTHLSIRIHHFIFVSGATIACSSHLQSTSLYIHLVLSTLPRSVLFAIAPVTHSSPMHHSHTHSKVFVFKMNCHRCCLTFNAISLPHTAIGFIWLRLTCSPIVPPFWHSCYTDFGTHFSSLFGLHSCFDLSYAYFSFHLSPSLRVLLFVPALLIFRCVHFLTLRFDVLGRPLIDTWCLTCINTLSQFDWNNHLSLAFLLFSLCAVCHCPLALHLRPFDVDSEAAMPINFNF